MTLQPLLPFLLVSLIMLSPAAMVAAESPPPWQATFDEICAGTTTAMSLSEVELEAMLESCMAVASELDGLDPTRAKIIRKRLDLACNLYRFVLEEKRTRKE